MPRGRNTKSVQAYIPSALEPRLDALAEHRGQSVSATAGDAVRDMILEFEGDDTNRSKLRRVEATMSRLERKQDMALLLLWRLIACDGKVEITADEVRRIRELVQEIVL